MVPVAFAALIAVTSADGRTPTIEPTDECPVVVQATRSTLADTFVFENPDQTVRIIPTGATDPDAVIAVVDDVNMEFASVDLIWFQRSPENMFVFRRDCAEGPRIVVVLRTRIGAETAFERIEFGDGRAPTFGPGWGYSDLVPMVVDQSIKSPTP
ncbi:MAG: hypothetical protein V4701_07740 [Pseudomonadota bacterium]